MRHVVSGLLVVLTLIRAGSLCAVESTAELRKASAVLKETDADKGAVVLTIGEGDYIFIAADDLKVRDVKGRELATGLKSRELKSGSGVAITYGKRGNTLILKSLELLATTPKPTKNPERTSVGFKPLCDMTAEDRYKGQDGGLYGRGRNEPPPRHQAAAKQETEKIIPRDADGNPSEDGSIVLISIGYSNVTSMFSMFKRIADADPQKSKSVTLVDCAQGGQTMARWAQADHKSWDVAGESLKKAGVTPKEVQVVWMKLANGSPAGEFHEHAGRLRQDTVEVLHNLRTSFPNLRIVYLGSRIYGGYATGQLNPEPYAYEGAFVVRSLIQDQINNAPSLNFDPARGVVKAPLLLWGPYLWADGTTPRSCDGLVWESRDVAADGVHPTTSGRIKVANMLLKFLKSDVNAQTWFLKSKADN